MNFITTSWILELNFGRVAQKENVVIISVSAKIFSILAFLRAAASGVTAWLSRSGANVIIIKTLGVEHFLAFVGSVRTDISILTKILFCDTPPLRHGRAPDIWQKVGDGSPHPHTVQTESLKWNPSNDPFKKRKPSFFHIFNWRLEYLHLPVNHRQPKYWSLPSVDWFDLLDYIRISE